jgi:hypothetical protein
MFRARPLPSKYTDVFALDNFPTGDKIEVIGELENDPRTNHEAA